MLVSASQNLHLALGRYVLLDYLEFFFLIPMSEISPAS